MKILHFVAFAALISLVRGENPAPVEIISDHKPKAEIVIAENPPRMTGFAAKELQAFLEKISGAHLEIVTQPHQEVPVKIYVGRSKYTDDLGIKTDDLANGAYRIRTGPGWLALAGRDKDFTPKEPWPKTHAGMEEFWKNWDEKTGALWGNAFASDLMRSYNKTFDLWAYDEGGSLNAVYGFLRSLGAEWYMAGDLGEILPHLASITVPPTDETVRPDFGLRHHHDTPFWVNNQEAVLWYLRQGLNQSSDEIGKASSAIPHGMADVHRRKEFQEAHPDYFALRAGKRATALNQPCLSSEGLFQEQVRYIRFLFDYYDLPIISLLPEDGAVFCECPDCLAKSTPERGWLGSHSDYVWGYVNRIAQEIYKTHPNKMLNCLAYADYVLPPEKIDKLSPNLMIGLLVYRQTFSDPAKLQQYEDSLAAWKKKIAPGAKIFIASHYPFTAPGRPSNGLPLYMPHNIAKNLRGLKGLSVGEFVETQFDPEKRGLHAPIFNHLNSFVTARLYWNADQDVDQLLARYYREFYGPAAEPMREFVNYCEQNLEGLYKDKAVIDKALALFANVKKAAGKDTVYAQRIQDLSDYLKPLTAIRERLERGRENVPQVRIRELKDAKVTIDGKLDESAWLDLPASGDLVNPETGKPVSQQTSFKIFWSADSLYVGITCKERDPSRLSREPIAHDNQRVWESDHVETFIETNLHSFYQLTVTASGATADMDRVNGEINPLWSAGADVATYIGKGYWSVEIRFPIAAPGHLDPLHNMVGTKPTTIQPWFFNIGRMVKPASGPAEPSVFSPTGKLLFADVDHFAELYTGIKDADLEKSRKSPVQKPTPAPK